MERAIKRVNWSVYSTVGLINPVMLFYGVSRKLQAQSSENEIETLTTLTSHTVHTYTIAINIKGTNLSGRMMVHACDPSQYLGGKGRISLRPAWAA